MFKAVRDSILGYGHRIGAAWQDLRGKGMARLFLFEFSVVLLGVLAAQGVQSWARERERRADIDDEIAQLEDLFSEGENASKVWSAAIPCLRERVGEIMRVAGRSESLPGNKALRPIFPMNPTYTVQEDNSDLIEERAGPQQAFDLFGMATRLTLLSEGKERIISRWELFRLLDADYGQPSAADRATVRSAAAEILAELRSTEIATDYMSELAQRTNVIDRRPFDPTRNLLPIRNCAELWSTGRAYRYTPAP